MKRRFMAILLTASLLAGSVCGTAYAEENVSMDDVKEKQDQTVPEDGTNQTQNEQNNDQIPSYELIVPEDMILDLPEIQLENRSIDEEQQNEMILEKQDTNKLSSTEDTQPYSDDAENENNPWQNMTDIQFTFEDAYDIMTQYITKDEKTAKLLNNNILYSYNIDTDQVRVEYTFPIAEYSYEGRYYGSQHQITAFIREDAGILYYGYNSYYNTYSTDEILNVVIYDLEKGEVIDTVSMNGHILQSVGADQKGNIYIATDDYYEAPNSEAESILFVLSPEGNQLCEKKLTYQIDSFSGFCPDGTFYYIDQYMAYSWGYGNLMGRLMQGNFQNNTITLNETYMDYVKNIYFSNYRTPVEIINDEYLVTCWGEFYPLSKITDSSWSLTFYAEKDLEMGDDHDYIYNAGVNAVIFGNDVYTLYDNDTIFMYSMSSGEKKKIYNADAKIFNMKKCGNSLLALETDGSHFFYRKISTENMTPVEKQIYNMNDFAVYKGRTKTDIVNRFKAVAPANMEATLYATNGSGKSPYKESTLTAATKKYAVDISNYYRWLAGLTTFNSAATDVWTNAAKGAVLLSASSFSHYPDQPSDMDTAFYNAAYEGTSNSNLALNYSDKQYKIIYSIRQFMDDTNYTVPGHRNTFLTRNATNIAYGIYNQYLCQTVEYTGNPNPLGTAVMDNNEAAYAWPAAGYFPAEDLSTEAFWTVNLNTDKLSLSNLNLQVTITDLDTGKTYKRTSSSGDLYSSSYWGKYICFAPPALDKDSYNNKSYKVTLENLSNSDGIPATLEYTIHFFSYSEFQCDAYGQPIKPDDKSDSETTNTSAPKKGTVLKSGKNSYKVTKKGSTVSFTKTTSTASTITIPATVKIKGITYKVTSVAAKALKGNKKVTKIKIGKNVTSIGSNSFNGCKKLKSVTIGNNVKSIGTGAFKNCTALTKITIPSKVTSIGKEAFSGCKKLKTVSIGKNVKSIGASAFKNCTALTKITIPSKVTSIGKEAFRGCKKLSTITIKSKKLNSVGKNAFKGIKSTAKIKVPSKKLNTYKKLLKKKGQGSKVKIIKL